MPQHTVSRVVYRYLSGRPIDGRPGYPYLKPGPGRWPGYRRQLWRLAAPAVGVAAYAEPVATAGSATAAAAVSAYLARQTWQQRRFDRAYTRPTTTALRHALGGADINLHIDPALGGLTARLTKPMSPAEREWRARYARHVEPLIRWPRNQAWRAWVQAKRRATPVTTRIDRWRRPVADHGPSITLAVPGREWLTEEQRTHVAAIIAGKLPVPDLAPAQWDTVGPTVTARWTVRKRPPSRVGRADFDARTAGLPDHEYWLGLAAGGRSVKISLKADSPHIGISAASGAGKSVLAMLLIVQTLHRGGEVYILDVKGSHRWALGLPGVTYCRTEQQIHDAWVSLGQLARDRNDAAFADPAAEQRFRRVLVIAEELNGMQDALADYWADVRESSRERDPAMRGMRDILRMGRSARVHIAAIAQRLSAAASGNGDARENLGAALCLARYSANTWRMLCEGIPMPPASSTLGRWQIVTAGKATETQVCLLGEWDARLMVLASAPRPASACPPAPADALVADNQQMSAGQPDTADTPADPLSELVTLKQAAEEGLVPWKPEAARKRLRRAESRGSDSIPTARGKRGQGDLYRVGDLIAWAESERVS